MSERLTHQQFSTMTPDMQALMISRGLAPEGVAAPIAQNTAQPTPAPQTPTGIASLDDVPDQSGTGPAFLPWAEFDCTCTLDQVQHRVGHRVGPNYYAVLTVVQASESAIRAGIVEGQTRSLMWSYNPNAYGTEADKSKANVSRYKQFVRQVCGLPDGAKVDAQSAQLLADSARVPSLGRKVRIISVQGSEMKKSPGKFFYNLAFIPLS